MILTPPTYSRMPGGLGLPGSGMQMPIHPQHLHSPFGPNMGMDMGIHPGMVHPGMVHPGMTQNDPFGFMNMNPGMPMMQSYPYPELSGLSSMPMSSLFGPRPRRRRSSYQDLYSYGGGSGLGRSSSRYLDPYDMFDDIFDESDLYLDDYDDIDDPLMLYMRMARGGGGGGGGRRGGRRGGRYGRGMGYRGFFD
jgi:hypothetical protein